MKEYLIQNGTLINENQIFKADVFIKDGIIQEIFPGKCNENLPGEVVRINAAGQFVIPGVIDDQVHFREPGLTYKADIETEAKVAIAGGVTSFMEMPNTVPQTTTLELLEAKYELASRKSLANYSFFMGATNDNLYELLKTNPEKVCGIKIFLGSSTGNMLVDNQQTLEAIFAKCPNLIAIHSEDEVVIKENMKTHGLANLDADVPIVYHTLIRNDRACYTMTRKAVNLATKHNTRLHILHLSTAEEVDMLTNKIPAAEKRITSEVTIHHLWFQTDDYKHYGAKIKWNPSIKEELHRKALWEGISDDRIDIIATDHAPHSWEEKSSLPPLKSPSGGPMVQHSLAAMIEFYKDKRISLEKIIEKMCHTPAQIFKIKNRGFLRKNYFADIAIIDINKSYMIQKDNILYKCGWSPFEGLVFNTQVTHTFVNGNLVYCAGKFYEEIKGQRLEFFM